MTVTDDSASMVSTVVNMKTDFVAALDAWRAAMTESPKAEREGLIMHSNDVVAKDAHTLDYIRHLKEYLVTVITEAHRIKTLIAANEAVLSQNFEMGGQIKTGDGSLKPDESRDGDRDRMLEKLYEQKPTPANDANIAATNAALELVVAEALAA